MRSSKGWRAPPANWASRSSAATPPVAAPCFISITVLGEIAPGRALTRSGARPGDIIYVSGKLGRAQLGLELVLRGHARDRRMRALVQPHLYPKIRIKLGSWLAQQRIATSAMDLSDGLSTDLARLCAASKVGAKIYASKIPTAAIPPAAARNLGKRKLDPLQLALHGGEDYELLFTIPPRQAKKLHNAPGASALTPIGEITRDLDRRHRTLRRELSLQYGDRVGREQPEGPSGRTDRDQPRRRHVRRHHRTCVGRGLHRRDTGLQHEAVVILHYERGPTWSEHCVVIGQHDDESSRRDRPLADRWTSSSPKTAWPRPSIV